MDNVNHPVHYTGFSNGAEVIDITENLSFNLGNVVKYVARAGRKTEDPTEDLAKAKFYLEREIERLQPTEENVWTISMLMDQMQKLWDYRTHTIRRAWDRLDDVPPFTVVEDIDGDHYRRINGTSRFSFKLLGEDDEWETLEPEFFLHQEKYGPYTEVLDA